jgi:hypothetical protein
VTGILIYLVILALTVATIGFARQRARRLGANPLVAIRRKVAAERRLTRKNPTRFAADLAASLATLSQMLGKAGDRAGALKARREATEIVRRVAGLDLAKFELPLATHLFALSLLLKDAGDRAGALLANQDGTDIWRRLAAADPAAFEPSLANSLINLAATLGDVRDQGGAVTAAREAVEIGRRLARTNPERFEPSLATYYLPALSWHLSAAGDRDGAVAPIREAVEIHRRLADADAARFDSHLATCLSLLSDQLGVAGDRDGALAAIREVGEVHRRLARVNRARSKRAVVPKGRSLRFVARKLRTGLWVLAYRLVLHAWPHRLIEGAWVGLSARSRASQFCDVIDKALDLIKQHDPLRYARLTRDLKRVAIYVLPGATANFIPLVKVCAIDERLIAAHAFQPEIIAAVIVHEAAHARLASRGIGYEEKLRYRVEAVCARRERAFAAKLPNGQLVSEQAERRLALAPATFTDAATRERVYQGDVAAFSYLGVPTWRATANAAALRLVSRWFARRSSP